MAYTVGEISLLRELSELNGKALAAHNAVVILRDYPLDEAIKLIQLMSDEASENYTQTWKDLQKVNDERRIAADKRKAARNK